MGVVNGRRVVAREPVSNEVRAMVWDKSAGRCWYCGAQTNPFRDFRVDHFVPCWDGGASEIGNLVPCCAACNQKKGSGSLGDFRHTHWWRSSLLETSFWFEREGLGVGGDLQAMPHG